MPFDLQRARPLLQNGDLAKLFVEELGWEHCRQKLTLRAGETDYAFTAVAEKRGFTAWLCASVDGRLPDHSTRLKLDRALTQTSFEHLIVFATHDRALQSWMWVRRETGKPLSARTHEFNRGQPGDSLLQKLQLLFISLEEEEAGLSVTEIASRARAAFDIERVTKAFYRDFDTHRKAFLKFIDGIGEVADREWYASVMLNRLMFVYFIQRKGFLDGDHNYLRNRLDRCQKEQGKDKFYTFYRYFLLRLFHEGFGKRRKDRAPDLEKLLGNIPYLNGGLFDVHELEKPDRYGKDIQIEDKAFERVFDYFDQYQWHLDERPLRADNEINPDVLGYIFEKYINQKQMGAYYTKEDITEYISKNTVLPFLFDAARAKCKVAFDNSEGPTVWNLLRENPDRYIYAAVRHGTDKKLPPEIAAGLDTTKPNLIERRKAWNKPAPGEYALPTEIWREVVARRQRYEEVRRKLAAGEVREVNDFITVNLDLRQFTQDVVQNCEGPDLLMAFWQAITTITVLDPTGGSGAFIFAALNILEPLYEGCLDRMEAFLAEWGEAGEKLHPNYHKKFTEVLARVDAHPNATDPAQAAKHVSGKAFAEAIWHLAGVLPPMEEKRFHEAVLLRCKDPFFALVSQNLIDWDGRLIAKRGSPVADDPKVREHAIRAEMFRMAVEAEKVVVSGYVEPARLQLLSEHNPTLQDFYRVLVDSPFIPPGREYFFARGLYEGLNGDFLVAAHLLIPQFEHALRFHLEERGVNVTTFDQGVQELMDINKLFAFRPSGCREDLLQLLGQDQVFELEGLLIRRYGSNLRNSLAHGLFWPSQFFDTSVSYLWWVTLRLCVFHLFPHPSPPQATPPTPPATPTQETK